MPGKVNHIRPITALLLLTTLSACVNSPMTMPVSNLPDPSPPTVIAPATELAVPSTMVPLPPLPGTETGLASYYHPSLDGDITASGIAFDNSAMMAAHPTLPLGTMVRVTNLENSHAEVDVRITDRGPTQENVDEGVVIDLSGAAAEHLGMIHDGRVLVQLEVLEWGDNKRVRPHSLSGS